MIERDAYLSGNVRQKLATAEDKARNEPRYQANVYALQQVVPPTIPLALISFGLGSVWLPDELVTNFIQATLQLPEVSASYNNRSRQYDLDTPTHFYSSLNQSLGTSHRTALQLIDAALNSRSVIITKTITQDGKEGSRSVVTVRDVEATSQAIAAQERLNELFVDFAREQYESVIEETFNRLYNTHVPRRFARPAYGHYPNANPAITLRDHQFRAVERIKIQDTMLAHAVGSGKTYTMITGAMELKRLGIARKPLLVVQNSTVEDVARSWRLLYPSAVVYVPQRADLEASGRKRFLQRIATNYFDGIIIPQSFLKLIPDDPASEQAFLQEEIDRVEAAVAAAARQDKSRKSLVKRLNELRLRLEARRLRQADRKKDNILSFDELGIDALFLDECHKYKRLGFFTSRRGIKGIDSAGSEDALSAMFKCRSVQARQGRVVLATGTPISNTMAEAWTMLRFIAPDRLDEARISTFDQFAGAFGQLIASFELTTTGQFKAVSRFARFVNVRQLSELYRAHVDVVLNDDVVEFQRDQTLPVLKDGGFTKIVLPQTEGVQAELDTIRERLRWFEELTGSQKRENCHLPLVLFGQARKTTLDIRLLSARNEDEPGSKLNRAATEIVRLYQQSDSYKGTQLVFADVYQSPNGGSPASLFVEEDDISGSVARFNLFDDLKLKLVVAGIPASEVVVCPAEADKREAVFAKVRTGEIRVMLGTSERMGIGVNVQERLIGLHHLDAPNRPTDFEQRNGRIIRQGNLHAMWGIPIEILTYGVDRTLDATAYGRLAIKQKFINQVLKGHLTDEGMNDISADDDFAAMSFDQMMATLSGSQYALAYAAKQLDLSRLLTARKNWQRGVLDAQMQVERARRTLSVQVPLLPTLEAEVAVIRSRFLSDEQPNVDRTYQVDAVVVEGITYTEKFGGPVQQLLDRMRGQLKRRLTPQAVVTVNGLPLTLTGEVRQDIFTLRNEYVFTYQWGGSLQGEVMSGPGLFQSLRQSVAHAAHLPAQCQQRIIRASADEAAFIQRVNEPFRHSQKITELESEIADLQAAMLRESEPETVEVE